MDEGDRGREAGTRTTGAVIRLPSSSGGCLRSLSVWRVSAVYP